MIRKRMNNFFGYPAILQNMYKGAATSKRDKGGNTHATQTNLGGSCPRAGASPSGTSAVLPIPSPRSAMTGGYPAYVVPPTVPGS